LPLRWKNHGDYEAELIRRADRRLAAYRSNYGHDFASPAPLARRLHDYATYLRPPWLRRYTYRLRYRRRRVGTWPGYLAPAYRDAVLPDGLSQTKRLFRVERVADPDQYARILSLEYALHHFGSRVRLDF
jgi:asparagine synthase (glutamine-hydrolysing)